VLQILEPAQNEGAVSPGTGEGNVQVIAPWFCPEAADAARSTGAVGRHPVAERAFRSLEAAPGGRRVVPSVYPFPLNQHAHCESDHHGCDRFACRDRTSYRQVRGTAPGLVAVL